ncbi:hypothetical protein R1flu_021566 [Riccia fluitans]|uniref:Uncharacterized protein n=1 Tax=Riccia fluitans TaxID=41844 RepID=A0ABD1ZPR3_9MARC
MVPEEHSKKEANVVEEEMTIEDMGMEVPLVGELGKPIGVSQVVTTSVGVPSYLESMRIIACCGGLTEAKKKVDMAVEQPSVEPKLVEVKLTL